ncbi:hypothetical protein B0P06_000515 [Clostridium saccharoperbutylacetonicum]|jgi:hypothetical protein|uniref:Uncharacterized protein n=1 Tax=Clostridium saccharoperbutylacetonicum N1-4(HMT) TaxID=931276 RepID=M1LR58_9CLOT|nr:hypothetical protein [Clostridium saccharoperbutylacetonicum]AGF55395.1 hypothetical protein Cspa_c16250 [Clostridium saccharoperbutylacetonicum N1-4(HMT)]NRT63892.1 hypothetical protein [Clostridium saccharoperbutylacetonicum]NSB27257.1 hypothetical protein [Clostridium saccharoperbutylacetonicum]NSB40744.1 hypothetical protein [Clostridium saccharoperbutylacetonicum]
MKVEEEKILSVQKKCFKSILKANKHKEEDFSKIIKNFQKVHKKMFNVYLIAEKIENNAAVNAEEYSFIKENAPGLLQAAELENQRKNESKIEEKIQN